MTHSVTHGQTVASKYAGLGNAVTTGRTTPARMLGLVVGEAGCGKSFLLQSHPGAYILNLDETPAVCGTSEAVMFPTPGPDGRSVDERGNPIVLDWSALEGVSVLRRPQGTLSQHFAKRYYLPAVADVPTEAGVQA